MLIENCYNLIIFFQLLPLLVLWLMAFTVRVAKAEPVLGVGNSPSNSLEADVRKLVVIWLSMQMLVLVLELPPFPTMVPMMLDSMMLLVLEMIIW